MELHTELLACKFISEEARKDLKNAECEIFRDVPGLDSDIEIVELQHAGGKDRSGMYVWDVPREIQIESRGLYLYYCWSDEYNGYALTVWDEEMRPALVAEKTTEDAKDEESLGDLDAHPFYDLDAHPF